MPSIKLSLRSPSRHHQHKTLPTIEESWSQRWIILMFPFSCFMDAATRQHCRKAQLEFLKMSRDGLETRLAAVNAAIATLEQQQARTTAAGGATEEPAHS